MAELAVGQNRIVGRLTGNLDDLTFSEVTASFGIGKLDSAGYFNGTSNVPTLYDPSSTAWDDRGWTANSWSSTDFYHYWGFGDGGGVYDTLGVLHASDGGTTRYIEVGAVASSDTDTEGSFYNLYATTANDGSVYGTSLTFGVFHSGGGNIRLNLDTDGPTISAKARVLQTESMLSLTDSADSAIVDVTGDRKIGFFGATPVTQRTGVAVTAAGVHAALVSLGFITA